MKNTKLNIGQKIDRFEVERRLNDHQKGIDTYLAHDIDGSKVVVQLYDEDDFDKSGYSMLEHEDMGVLSQYPIFLPVFQVNTFVVDGTEYTYMVRQYIEGESVAERLKNKGTFSWEEAISILKPIVETMVLLHNHTPLILHNDISCNNIILRDCASNEPRVFLVGTNHMSDRIFGRPTFSTEDLNPWYRAPETYKGLYRPTSDIFSLGVVLYTMLKGTEPWKVDIPEEATPAMIKDIVSKVRGTMSATEIQNNLQIKDSQAKVLAMMLALSVGERFKCIEDVKLAFDTEIISASKGGRYNAIKTRVIKNKEHYRSQNGINEIRPQEKVATKPTKGGFADVAGMEGLKQELNDEVLFALRYRDRCREYRIKPPNGMLLYGPPGCGKTFIAEKFAQESQMNFKVIKGSDIGGSYIHETQGKIADLFSEALDRAPMILCFDEIDGMVPNRTQDMNDGFASEVNEFLCQLNNCGDKGIFVIGTTNCPERVDTALMRTGRLDKLVYVPMPDEDARRKLFEVEMRNRKSDADIDYVQLAKASDGCTASDISSIVNQAALRSAIENVPISYQRLLQMAQTGRRSIPKSETIRYNKLHEKFSNQSVTSHNTIGFMSKR